MNNHKALNNALCIKALDRLLPVSFYSVGGGGGMEHCFKVMMLSGDIKGYHCDLYPARNPGPQHQLRVNFSKL